MSARYRGDTHLYSRLRPPSARVIGPGDARPAAAKPASRRFTARLAAWTGRARWLLAAAVGAAVISGATITAELNRGGPAGAALPATPTAWIEQWSAAALENPAEVCRRLYAPALAAAYKADTGRTCESYYSSVTSGSFRVRHVLRDGATATVEAQELGKGARWGFFTVVLSHIAGGWQAVDVVPGGTVRAR